MNINTLEEENVKRDSEKVKSGKEDEILPQLTIHVLEKTSIKTFIRNLAKGEKFQNWVTQEDPMVLKM